jgi:EAL domain-containing protein (putative c-di-GMP-specific phosphodiesterase class I)/GGDEF domain-containing protein
VPLHASGASVASYHDVLQALDRDMAASTALAVLLIDLPSISKFQARMGYAGSASMLQALFDGFNAALGKAGYVMRLGDGSFCGVVRTVLNSGHAVLAGEKLLRTAEDIFSSAEMGIKPQLNIGVALFPAHARDPEALLRHAQLAAEASRSRSVRVVVYDPDCSSDVLEPWALGAAFAQALEGGELSVYYQPKISMATGRPVGVESLMRWLNEDGKPVATPDVFIPLAEEAGLIQSTTWYSLSNSMRMSADCAGLSVAVNITPRMLHAREFVDMIRTAISTWGIKQHQVTLEITEGGLIADFVQATARLKKLRDMGLRVSIDDFGTGYSSLSYFKKIPADELKIDKSFVMNMANDAADQHLVRTIIELASHFNLQVVAEGVENRATFELLANLGCHQAQGYLFSPALSLPRLKAWMAENSRDLRLPAT